LRQGIEVAANAIEETTTVENGGVAEEKSIEPGGLIETKGLQQIPYTQITLSDGVLKQNTGW
jgi:starch-binding outer membrane protein, SusD/RagB family